jgi:hypothetical protein
MSSQYNVMSFEQWNREFAEKYPFNAEFSSLGPPTFDHLKKLKPELQTVVAETDYIDFDYSAAYACFYCHLFKPPARSCTRYLFFSKDFKSIEAVKEAEVADSFKGFIVIWPTNPPVIGRCVLPFPQDSTGYQKRITVNYVAHLAGVKLNLQTAMFASKDHAVSACATIATWLCTDLLRHRFNLRNSSSSEITLLATGKDPKWGRPLPQTYGLDNEQITRALTAMEYSPHVYYFDPGSISPREQSRTWVGLLYGYILSGLPVILICEIENRGQHAIVVVGLETKTFIPEKIVSGPVGSKSFARAVTYFLAHDDRYGGFVKLIPDHETQFKASVKYFDGDSNKVDVKSLIVPLPSHVNIRSGEAHRLGVARLRRFFSEMLQKPEYNGPFQTYLKLSVDLKSETYTWPNEFQNAAKRIRELPLPKWIWVSEAYPENVVSTDAIPIGRVICDATQLRFNEQALFRGGHILDSFIPPR